jgi:hypothetical protein
MIIRINEFSCYDVEQHKDMRIRYNGEYHLCFGTSGLSIEFQTINLICDFAYAILDLVEHQELESESE